MSTQNCDFSVLQGKTLQLLKVSEDQIQFTTVEGAIYLLYHRQDCCESVYVEGITGDPNHLVGTPILLAEEVSNYDAPALSSNDIRFRWTFYRLATLKGYVTIRWYGKSSGYYSEKVDFKEVKNGRCH